MLTVGHALTRSPIIESIRVLGRCAVGIVPNDHVVEAVPGLFTDHLVLDSRGGIEEGPDLVILSAACGGIHKTFGRDDDLGHATGGDFRIADLVIGDGRRGIRLANVDIPLQLPISVRLGLSQLGPMLLGSQLVIEVIPQDATLHPVIDEPAVPSDLIHGPLVAPSDIFLLLDLAAVETRDLLGGFDPGFGIVDVGEDVVVLIDGAADVAYNEHYLVGVILPAPNAFMVRIIRLNERLLRHAQKFEIPRIPTAQPCHHLHLPQYHALVGAWISCNNCVLKHDVLGNGLWTARVLEEAPDFAFVAYPVI
mmetsp:Transcript_2172/g.4736  ORF Transcript_2172/g.4736 Transcript_2172/m.4736 type:complete len:308 (-) Transcript_2172:156-1079(-)